GSAKSPESRTQSSDCSPRPRTLSCSTLSGPWRDMDEETQHSRKSQRAATRTIVKQDGSVMVKIILKVTLPVLVLVVATLVTIGLIRSRQAPKTITPARQLPSVYTMSTQTHDEVITVTGLGTVIPAEQVIIRAEV